jgi:hypothetical protein
MVELTVIIHLEPLKNMALSGLVVLNCFIPFLSIQKPPLSLDIKGLVVLNCLVHAPPKESPSKVGLLFLIDIGPARFPPITRMFMGVPGGQFSTRGFFPFLACVPNLLGCRSAQEKKALRRIYQLKKYQN